MSAKTRVKEESDYVVTEYGQYRVVVKKEFEENCEADMKKARSDSEDALAVLYTDHVVKDELVLGPERPYRPNAVVVCEWALGDADGCPLAPGARGGAQFALRDCSVRLERLTQREAMHTDFWIESREHTLATLTDNEYNIEGEPNSDCQNEPCIICGKKFALKSALLKHTMDHIHVPQGSDMEEENSIIKVGSHREPYTCDICSETFILKLDLTKHAMSHIHVSIKTKREEDGYEAMHYDFPSQDCSVLASEFTKTSVTNNKHAEKTKIHTTENCYICDYCGKTLKRKVSLMNHIKFHHQNTQKRSNILQGSHAGKKHSCDECGRKFPSLSNLKIHRRCHTGEKPYACEVCNKKFTQAGDFKAHKRIHTGEKPYACEKCKKSFRRQTDLSRHTYDMHTLDKPHRCDLCGKTFTRLYRLTEHRPTHTGGKPYKCEICLKRYAYNEAFKSHLKVHMKKKKS